jgi:hypothetical protein
MEQFPEMGSTLEVKVLYFSFCNITCRCLKQKESFFNKPVTKHCIKQLPNAISRSEGQNKADLGYGMKKLAYLDGFLFIFKMIS